MDSSHAGLWVAFASLVLVVLGGWVRQSERIRALEAKMEMLLDGWRKVAKRRTDGNGDNGT